MSPSPYTFPTCKLIDLALLLEGTKKGNRSFDLLPNFSLTLTQIYAGAGLPPVIGGSIGFSGFAEGSLSWGRSSSLPGSATG